ncbi:MAG: aldo/keto reductase [Gemmatimonadetes bacterium]|nr:aldo/keto reductase [Gemmatimonadota bacterium]
MSEPRWLPAPPRTRPLFPGGPMVSTLSWGMWRMTGEDVAEARRLVEAALEAGITLLDTAGIYGYSSPSGFGGSERLLGRVLAQAPGLRERMVLATKGGIIPGTPYDSSAAYVAEAIDASLERLGVERVQLWQVHRPDILTHPQELARTLENAVASGKVAAVGVSNFTPAQVAALRTLLTVPLASLQPEFSPLHLEPMENGLFDEAMVYGTAVLAWSPLGGGRVMAPGTPREEAVAAALDVVAAAHGVSRSAAAYSWVMAHPVGAIPIVGSQQPARIAEAVDAYRVRWTRADWYKVLVASRGVRLP